jgi:hypothetical protein
LTEKQRLTPRTKLLKMKKIQFRIAAWSLLALGSLTYSCSNSDDPVNTTTTPITSVEGTTDITSVVQSKFLSPWVTITTSNGKITIKSDGRPNNHHSPYWGVGNALYEPFPAGHATNPNGSIGVQDYTMTIAAKPGVANIHEATGLGPIGMALNGVAIFNNDEMGGVALNAGTMTSFDGAGAHPAQAQDYHYHITGTYTTMDDANLVGFLRDGFPIYGRKDMDDTYPADLDEFSGHTGPTAEFPSGIYHYHTHNENYLNSGSYILKSGNYYGAKGTFAK